MPFLPHNSALPAAMAQMNVPASAERLKAALAEGQQQRTRGLYEKALGSFELAVRLARLLGNTQQEAVALNKSGATKLRLFRYRAALADLTSAHDLAIQNKDTSTAGAAGINLSTIYQQLGDFQRSEESASEAANLLEHTGRTDLYIRALLDLAETQLGQGEAAQSEATYRRAIGVAQKAHLQHEEAMAQNYLGIALIDKRDLAGAENALQEAYRLHTLEKDADGITMTHGAQADLRFEQGRYQESLKLLDKVVAAQNSSFRDMPRYEPTHLRGKILLALGRKDEALLESRKAVDQATAWRRGALPGDASNTRTVAILNEIYQNYTELGARLSLERHDSRLAVQALEALANNRAASLREQIAAALNRQGRLPPRYFELLSLLQSAQEESTLNPKPENAAKVRRLLLELSDLDNRLGIEAEHSSKEIERSSHKRTLSDIQSRLTAEELLLSFCLGKAHSYLWAVTRDQVNLYQLAGSEEIGAHAAAFSDAVRLNKDSEAAGQRLSSELLGQLSQQNWRKQAWLVVGDGALLSGLPVAALPQPGAAKSETISLAHSLRYLPSELLLLEPPSTASGGFLGIGDPIYNGADSRSLRQQHKPANDGHRQKPKITLARLLASDREVRASARTSGLAGVEILVGKDASTGRLRQALENRPAIIHFAVHVVSPEGHPEQAALALSIAGDYPELLTPEIVASLHVPGSLVVLSGCASVQGQTLPSAGVIGLSRAWLVAGASAVVVSAWPTPDNSGRFFTSFYSHLQCPKVKAALPKQAAMALQLAQIDMQRGEGAKSAPSVWAAYSIISKE